MLSSFSGLFSKLCTTLLNIYGALNIAGLVEEHGLIVKRGRIDVSLQIVPADLHKRR